jgi:ribosomal protein S28E/S33
MASVEVQESPDTTRCHLVQLDGDPVNVGPGDVVALSEVERELELTT